MVLNFSPHTLQLNFFLLKKSNLMREVFRSNYINDPACIRLDGKPLTKVRSCKGETVPTCSLVRS